MERGQHQCLVFSLAMLLDESPDALIEELGHDGTEVWWPDWPVPHCYRGHHIQEVIDLCLGRGIFLTPIEFYPCTASAKSPHVSRPIWPLTRASARFQDYIRGKPGLLIGQAASGGGHACAWDGHIVWDPNGRKYPLSDFRISECWILAITS